MAFLDELSRKLTDAGKVVVRKTREITDVSSLKLRIADENRRISRLYEDLGKEYFALNQAEPQEELKALVGQIKASMEKVSALEAEIEKVEKESREQAEEERKKRTWKAEQQEAPIMDTDAREVHEKNEEEPSDTNEEEHLQETKKDMEENNHTESEMETDRNTVDPEKQKEEIAE